MIVVTAAMGQVLVEPRVLVLGQMLSCSECQRLLAGNVGLNFNYY